MKEYKVVYIKANIPSVDVYADGEKVNSFSWDRKTPSQLLAEQKCLNEYAQQGWRLVQAEGVLNPKLYLERDV